MASTTSHLRTALAVLMLFIVTIQAQNEYAEKIKACAALGEEKMGPCIKDYLLELAPKAANGIPELKIPPMDPMSVEDFKIEEDGAAIQAKASFYNVTAKGASKYQIESVTLDKAKKTMKIRLLIPILNVAGLYEITGTIMLLPVNGKGPFSVNCTNVKSDAIGHFALKDGRVILDKMDVPFEIETIQISLDGLFDGDAVGQSVTKMLNENSKALLDEIRLDVEKIISKALQTAFKEALVDVPKEIIGF